MTYGDFVTSDVVTTTEVKVGTISVPGGSTLKQITFATRTAVSRITAIRIDYTGIKTPKKWAVPCVFDMAGTEVQTPAQFMAKPINVDIKLPSNVSSVDVYATADAASTLVAVGLVWV